MMAPGETAPRPEATPPRPAGWFHSFRLPDETIAGDRPLVQLQAEAELIFRHGVQGRRVLDIGAWDGFFAFEAEARGARDVLATDHYCWSGPGCGDRAGFDYVHWRLASKVRALDIDVPDLDPAALGRFDMVMLLGVLYHVKDPYGCLERAAAMCSGQLVVETETALEQLTVPAMRLYRPGELMDDPTNIWAPNRAALAELLNRLGFTRVEMHESPSFAPLHAYRRSPRGRLRQALVRLGLKPPLPHADRGRVLVHAFR